MKSIDAISFQGKKVLVRVDYNVPLNEQFEVTNSTRITRTLNTVHKIINEGGVAILMSHLGRPKGEVNEKYSLKHIIPTLSEVMEREITFVDNYLTQEGVDLIHQLKPGSIALLENLRFDKREEKGDEEFARQLSLLGDIYVNDAFGTAHREHASTATITKFFPGKAYAGYLLYDEVVSLKKVLDDQKPNFTAIIGGSKISTKINIVKNLITKVENLIIAGGMSYTFLKAMGINIADSIVEDDMIPVAEEIIQLAHLKGVNLYLPVDNVCADQFDPNANKQVTTENHIPDGWMGMDIGPKTIERLTRVVNQSQTILWNGPVGVFEFDAFGKGTQAIAIAVASATLGGAFSLIGGGDTITAVEKYGMSEFCSYISTGGGAMLEYLEGITLPGIKALEEN
ncbi:MAG TPA: phosphoglycerate kinase [Bacteroidales bacterium]|nr:phosphoglycerate kinase [Bacteroidales bacterium]HOH22634.1 phosphoglycerate kinase [Bacteroidales bacterium]HPZ03779.1 phosphoglycerate kinase [Bacteroidales bacterium]HQB75329.1 phosphoglycerate kinase [Bacteroidales bacterium]HQQ20345.1 phosphoglycerate kinase [Bacteroidales bacterium]